MRAVAHAVTALATSPEGFTASQLAQKVSTLSSPPQPQYGPRHAAYDLKQLRGKKLVEKIGSSHRYQPTRQGLRALTALLVLRDKVIKPLLASSCQLQRGPKAKNTTRLDQTTIGFRLACGTCSPRWVLPHEKDRQLFVDVVSVSAYARSGTTPRTSGPCGAAEVRSRGSQKPEFAFAARHMFSCQTCLTR